MRNDTLGNLFGRFFLVTRISDEGSLTEYQNFSLYFFRDGRDESDGRIVHHGLYGLLGHHSHQGSHGRHGSHGVMEVFDFPKKYNNKK